jgi:hypothetical protein
MAATQVQELVDIQAGVAAELAGLEHLARQLVVLVVLV